jgi:hypothetical protein
MPVEIVFQLGGANPKANIGSEGSTFTERKLHRQQGLDIDTPQAARPWLANPPDSSDAASRRWT